MRRAEYLCVSDAGTRAQRLLDEEKTLDYERLQAENQRLQLEKAELEHLRIQNWVWPPSLHS